MTGRDPAFLWETEALRASPRPHAAGAPPPGEWVTLQEAHAATGIPVNTLRKWARRGYVDSHLDDTPQGMRRMLRFESVVEHAAAVDREIAPVGDGDAAATALQADAEPPERPEAEPSPPSEATAAEPAAPPQGEPAPAGTMIVPIDAWNKMLLQLGNLHEAGQQLAEARERAARAETEATFLRERLAELRSTAQVRPAAKGDPQPGEPVPPRAPEQRPTPDAAAFETWWRYAGRRWQERRRRR